MKNICPKCNSFILRPTCALCLTDEIEAWLEQNKITLLPKFKDHIRAFIERTKNSDMGRCSFCFMDTRHLACLYCYTKYVYEWLESTDIETSKGFLEFFKDILSKPTTLYA